MYRPNILKQNEWLNSQACLDMELQAGKSCVYSDWQQKHGDLLR